MSGAGATAVLAAKPPARPEFRVAEGLTPYPEALAAMEARVAAIRSLMMPAFVACWYPPSFSVSWKKAHA